MDRAFVREEDYDDNDDERFKSKNLKAERRRRKKLSDRQLQLRALVPIITNMNKGTIITDAITYIEELKESVEELSNQLSEMEASSRYEERIKPETDDDGQEMKKWGIEAEVEVIRISGTKLWVKIVCPKKRGGLVKLMEAMSVLGFDLNDTSITTSRGAVLFTSCHEVMSNNFHGGMPDTDKIKKRLWEIIESI